MKNLIIIHYLLLCPLFVFSQSMTSFRPTKVRKWHCELAWEAISGATGYEVQWQSIGDNDGYFDPETTGGWQTIDEGTTPKIVISGTTAVVTNMETNTRHKFRIRPVGVSMDWTRAMPVRTGLFPKETTTYTNSVITHRPRPNAGNFTPIIGEFGTTEFRVSDIARDGNTNAAMVPYPKVQRTYQFTDGTGFLRGISTGSGLNKWDVNTYQPVLIANGIVREYPSIRPTPPSVTKFWDSGFYGQGGGLNRGKFVENINGVERLLYDVAPHEGRNGNAASITRKGENRMSWDERYVAFEYYKGGNYADAWGGIFDMQTEALISEWNSGIDIEEGQITMSPSGKFIHYDSSAGGLDGAHSIVRINNAVNGTQDAVSYMDFDDDGITSGHGDLGQTIQGNDCWVGRKGGRLVMHIFEGPKAGQTIDLINQVSRNSEIGHISAQVYLHEGWAITNTVVNVGCSDCGELGYFQKKIYAIQLDESCEDRGENALVRFYARVNAIKPELQPANGVNVSEHVDPTRDMTKVFWNNYVTEAGGTNFGEVWGVQQLVEHGDEIPFSGVNNQTATLDPIHDAYLEGSNRFNNNFLRVEQGARVGYLKFDLGSVTGNITSAEFRFRVDVDAGSGTAEIYKGMATSWTETNLSTSNAPAKNGLLGSTTDIGQMTTTVAVPLSVATLSGGGELSLVVEHVGSSDFWMASDESPNAPGPQLVVTYEPSTNIPVTGVTVAPGTLAMETGDTETLMATIVPANATDQGVSWSSSDTAIATVDASGLVTAVAVGSATITVTTNDGDFTASANATVTSSAPIVSNITVSDIMEDSFKVSWNLNEGSKGRIEYGTSSGNYTEQTTSAENFLTFHLQTVGNNNAPPLQSGTTYYWRIRTEDIDGNIGYSDEQTTTTASPQPQTTTLVPIHDAHLEGSVRKNQARVKMQQNNRVGYLKFDLSSVNGTISSAELHFRVNGDTGTGTAEIYKGTASSWTETNLSTSNKPAKNGLLGSTTDIGQTTTTVVVILSAGALTGGGDLSLIVEHVGSDDFWMASKENTFVPGPELVVTYIPSSGSSLKATINMDNSVDTDGIALLYPNPTTNAVQIYGIDGEKEITVIDFSGKLLMEATSKEAEPVIDLSGYASGIYYMRVESSGISKTFKIVKQ